eukprot:gene20263-20840_t
MTTKRFPLPATANLSSGPLARVGAAGEWEHHAGGWIRTFVPLRMLWPQFRCAGQLPRPRDGKIPPLTACNATAKPVSEPPIAGGPKPAGLVFPEMHPERHHTADFCGFRIRGSPGVSVCIRRIWGYFWGYRTDAPKSDTPTMALNDTAIRASKPKDAPYTLADSGGLYLLINPTGSRLWRLKYRFGGKEKVLAIGAYPAVSLAAAREQRDKAKTLLAQGGDPSEAKQDAKREIEATTSTLLNESGRWSEDAIERQLAHLEKNDIRRAYARGEHWDERVRMLAWWADHLDMLRKGGEVVPIESAAKRA